MNTFLPSHLKPLDSSLTNNKKIDILKYPARCYNKVCCKNKNDKLKECEKKKEEKVNFFKKLYNRSKKNKINSIFFNQTQYIVDIVIFMTLYATIGLLCPLVGIIICISLYLYIHSVLSSIGGKLTNATKEDKENLEKECENIVDDLNINLNRYILPMIGLFFSLFVFDTIGDAEGSDVAIWYLIFTLLIPFLLWLIKRLYLLYSYIKSTQKKEKVKEGISLQNIVKNRIVNNPLNIMS